MHRWTTVQKYQDVDLDMERRPDSVTGAGRRGWAVKAPRTPLPSGEWHKYSAVFTKQAARVTSCVCVSQILLMSELNQRPHPSPPCPRPLTSIRTLAKVENAHTHIPISAHLAFQLLLHFFPSPPCGHPPPPQKKG